MASYMYVTYEKLTTRPLLNHHRAVVWSEVPVLTDCVRPSRRLGKRHACGKAADHSTLSYAHCRVSESVAVRAAVVLARCAGSTDCWHDSGECATSTSASPPS